MLAIFLLFALITASYGAIGINIENDNDCGCNKEIKNNGSENIQYYLGELISEEPLPEGKIFQGRAPSSLDWRNKDGHDWTTGIKNQESCGSCYAFGSLACVEACINIENNNPNLDFDLSEQFMVSCGLEWYPGEMFGCNGSYAYATHDFLSERGAIPESCFPYTSGNGNVPSCSSKCEDWQEKVISIESEKIFSSVDSIKNALNDYGPVSASFEVFEDFKDYNGGIYEYQSGQSLGHHRISIVGYNDDPGYWICKNSWGAIWGENGWFRIAYGECSIENAVYYVDPDYLVSTEEKCYGDQYYEKDGDCEDYDASDMNGGSKNAVRMGEKGWPNSEPGWARYSFDIGDYDFVEDYIEIGVEFADVGWFGNGPHIYLNNTKTKQWEKIANNIGSQDTLVWKWYIQLPKEKYVKENGIVQIWVYAEESDDTILDEVGIRYTPKPRIANLDCPENSLNFEEVKSGDTKTLTFTVKNIGDPESKLDWKVDSNNLPEWGSWIFSPNSGTGLTPEQAGATVTVRVTAIGNKGDHTGKITVVNTANNDDQEKITVSMTISRSRTRANTNLLLQRFLENFPTFSLLLKIL